MIYFTKEQFAAGLRLPLPSLLKQFLNFTQISFAFLYLNVIQILMGCSVLNMLFQLDLSLLEVLFIYTIKRAQMRGSTCLPTFLFYICDQSFGLEQRLGQRACFSVWPLEWFV